MSVKINSRTDNNVTVLDIAGRITQGEGSQLFREAIQTAVFGRPLTEAEFIGRVAKPPGKAINVLLNLSEVPYIDSSGKGALVSGFSLVVNNGGRLQLLNPVGRVWDELRLSRFDTFLKAHKDEVAAISSF